MATARALDEWDDPGLAFSAEEVEEYNLDQVILLRLAELQDLYLVIKASEMLPYGLAHWANSSSANVRSWITWICRQTETEMPEIHGWEPGSGEERKPYTARAQKAGPWGISCAELSRAETHLTKAVTLGRKADRIQRWTKSQRSRSNRYCNALLKQVEGCHHWKMVVKSHYPPSLRGDLED